MAGHAKLSPSAAHRWMNCPGSIKKIGDESSTTNQAAMKGTAAHKVIEMMIQRDEHDAGLYLGYSALVKADGDEETRLFPPGIPALDPDKPKPGWFLFIVDEEMVNGIQCTIDEVDRQREMLFQPEVFSETYLDGSWLDSRCGGTADVRLVEPFGWAVLVDHKNGYLLVEAKDNEQLLNYAVFVLHEHPDAEGVRVIISQPNAPHVDGPVREAEYTRDQIKLFEIRMKEAAEATDAPNAPLRPGDWCTFCPANHRCEELEKKLKEEALEEFADDDEPPADPVDAAARNMPKTVEELARVAKWIPLMDARARNIKAAIQQELENGNKVPGWKLVRGKSNRRWPEGTDPVTIAQEFVDLGVPNEQLWTDPELKSPAQIEKLGPKGRKKAATEARNIIKAKVAELAFKPEGAITIAEDHDPRETVDSAQSAIDEFGDDEGDDFGP